MKTAISIPDEQFEQAEQLASKLGKSRSELYREALAEYIARHDPEAVTEQMDRVCAELDSRPVELVRHAGARALTSSEW